MNLSSTHANFATRVLGASLVGKSVRLCATGHGRDLWERLAKGESPADPANLYALRSVALSAALDAPGVNVMNGETSLACEASHVRDALRGLTPDALREAGMGRGPAWNAAREAVVRARPVLYANPPGAPRIRSY